jgi:hypothetical protein
MKNHQDIKAVFEWREELMNIEINLSEGILPTIRCPYMRLSIAAIQNGVMD